jgi:hypothetical protein
MPLYRLSYFSIVNPKQGDEWEVVRTVTEQARLENPARDIGGFLLYADNYFLQILEGRRRVVSDLMGRIYADLRHVAVQITSAEPVLERAFDGMTTVIVECPARRAILRRFMGGDVFNPAEMAPAAYLGLAQGYMDGPSEWTVRSRTIA